MTFFNKKTEVMKVQLTPYGRYLLSVGKLKPHSYRFFDDTVIYDTTGSISGSGEHRSNVDNRIVNNTPKLKSNPNMSGVETNYNNFQAVDVTLDHQRFNIKDDTINILTRPIGTIKPEAVNTTGFKVSITDSEIANAEKFYNSDSSVDVNIPQIDIDIEFVGTITNTGVENQFDTTIDYQSNEFLNGETYNIHPEIPILQILEKNGLDEKENFHVSVYKVVDSGGITDIEYTKMQLENQTTSIVNDNLLEEDQIFLNQNISLLEPDQVRYYFNMVYDYDIQDSEFCRQIGDIPVVNIYLDKEIKCPDPEFDAIGDYDPYTNQILPQDLEDCD